MNLEQQLQELKMDYIRLQDDLEKRESTSQQVDPLIKQLEQLELQMATVRQQLHQQDHL
ncbi:SE1832 family protein [Staphylococcus lutrae]|uniref:SE1832 family protein n=1 Tax=Staphylococcus lutrae TaxID=155085 RepID=UPI00146A373B|nr:SE1832 family protein [Staphylococcus lutrae]